MSELEVNQQPLSPMQPNEDQRYMCQNPMYGQYPSYGMDPWQGYQECNQNEQEYTWQSDRCPYCGRTYQDFQTQEVETEETEEANTDFHRRRCCPPFPPYNRWQGGGYRYDYPYYNPYRRRRRLFPFFF